MLKKLYTDMKTVLIHPANVTGMHKQYRHTLNSTKRTRRHGKTTWFSDEFEILCKKCSQQSLES